MIDIVCSSLSKVCIFWKQVLLVSCYWVNGFVLAYGNVIKFSTFYVILGLANKKTVTIQPADKEQAVVLATTKTKKQNQPKLSVNKSVLKKEFSRMSKAVANQV